MVVWPLEKREAGQRMQHNTAASHFWSAKRKRNWILCIFPTTEVCFAYQHTFHPAKFHKASFDLLFLAFSFFSCSAVRIGEFVSCTRSHCNVLKQITLKNKNKNSSLLLVWWTLTRTKGQGCVRAEGLQERGKPASVGMVAEFDFLRESVLLLLLKKTSF